MGKTNYQTAAVVRNTTAQTCKHAEMGKIIIKLLQSFVTRLLKHGSIGTLTWERIIIKLLQLFVTRLLKHVSIGTLKWERIIIKLLQLFITRLFKHGSIGTLTQGKETFLEISNKSETQIEYTVMIQSFRTDRSRQTVQTQIRLLLVEQSDQGLHCLLFHLHLFVKIPKGLVSFLEF